MFRPIELFDVLGFTFEFLKTLILTFDSGETEWNREGKLQGQTDIELNQTGRDQASKASQRLKDESFDKVANINIYTYFLTSQIRLTVTVLTVDMIHNNFT